jgi:hypothetical protein
VEDSYSLLKFFLKDLVSSGNYYSKNVSSCEIKVDFVTDQTNLEGQFSGHSSFSPLLDTWSKF